MSQYEVSKSKTIIGILLSIIIIGPAIIILNFSLNNHQTTQTTNQQTSDILVESSATPLNSEEPRQPSATTLAEQINLSLNTITTWTSSIRIWHRGYVFGKVTAFDLDQIISNYQVDNNWIKVLETKSYAEMINYTSSTIDNAVKWALNAAPMFSNYSLVKEYSKSTRIAFCVWDRWLLHGYRYARELNYLTAKWNTTSAFEGMKAVRDAFGRAFYDCNPDALSAKAMSYGTRWMSTSNLADCFMMFYHETGLEEALDYALQEWDDLNALYWDPDKEYYVYATNWRTWEWSAIEVCFNYDKLRQLNGTLEKWNRIYIDLQNRYLADKWFSPQWSGTIVVHSPGSSQRRLFATENAWHLLLTYFGNFSLSNQTNMKNMLEGVGVTQAWRGLLSTGGGCYDSSTYRFRHDSDEPISDHGTAIGCMTLFLQGISPQSGAGLIIPKRCQSYAATPVPFDVFRYYPSTHQILIPVYGGTTLKFLYGSSYPTYTFSEDGVYLITFSSDWNSIISVELGGQVPVQEIQYIYLLPLLMVVIVVLLVLFLRKKTQN